MSDLSLVLIISGSICLCSLFVLNQFEESHPYVFMYIAFITLYCFVGAYIVRLLGAA